MNRIVHEQSRLKILAALAGGESPESFSSLREKLDMTAGNLSVQLKTLEEAGYVGTEKYFAGNKPRTDVSITDGGRAALMEYLEELESLLAGLRSGTRS